MKYRFTPAGDKVSEGDVGECATPLTSPERHGRDGVMTMWVRTS